MNIRWRLRRRSAAPSLPGVFLWSKRNQISDQIASSVRPDQRMARGDAVRRRFGEDFMAQRETIDIAEEALTLKSTGKKTKRPTNLDGQGADQGRRGRRLRPRSQTMEGRFRAPLFYP